MHIHYVHVYMCKTGFIITDQCPWRLYINLLGAVWVTLASVATCAVSRATSSLSLATAARRVSTSCCSSDNWCNIDSTSWVRMQCRGNQGRQHTSRKYMLYSHFHSTTVHYWISDIATVYVPVPCCVSQAGVALIHSSWEKPSHQLQQDGADLLPDVTWSNEVVLW